MRHCLVKVAILAGLSVYTNVASYAEWIEKNMNYNYVGIQFFLSKIDIAK